MARLTPAPPDRVRAVNEAPPRPDGAFVLYWMIAARRTRSSFALQHAAARAAEWGRPLVVLEPLRVAYPWASDRLHRFVLDGMADQAAAFEAAGVAYHPYLEPRPGDGQGLLQTMARDACCVVTDDFPAFFLPRMVAAAGRQLTTRLEAVDGNGLLPLTATDRAWGTAFAFRRFVQREIRRVLADPPLPDPLAGLALPRAPKLPPAVTRRWPAAPAALLAGRDGLAAFPIDHQVGPAPFRGGQEAARAALDRFLDRRLGQYLAHRDDPDHEATSGLSPYLHFGHLSAHEVFDALMARERWSPARLGSRATGAREGFWGVGPDAEAFLDQLVTWRELGLNFCAHRDDADRWEGLPDWARATLEAHARDRRPALYTFERLERAETDDPVWNAAQRQLVTEGRLHNRLRMVWGKRVLAWTRHPQQAFEWLVALNDRWAVDGRDPNSYSGIGWCFGRYDRPWGPERPIYGKVRYMTSDSARRKHAMSAYLARFGPASERS